MRRPRIAQVGCGHWGKNLARNFAELGALAAVSDADPDTASHVAAANGVEPRSFESLLNDPEIEALAIATPAATHADMAMRALAAGKHVFVEKPLSLNAVDALMLVERSEQSGRVLMVGHLLQYHPIFIELRRRVDLGEIGRLQYIYSNRLSLGKIRTEENVLWSFAPHDLSMILAVAGEEPTEVDARGAAIVNGGIADWCICTMNFPSGLRAHVHASWLHPFKEQRLVVVGDRGMAVFEDSHPDWDRRLAIYPHRIDYAPSGPVPVRAEPDYVAVDHDEPLRAECRHFIQCICDGTLARTDGREGLRVLNVLNRAEVALREALEQVGP
jgi:predicted dehydrogenase